MHISWSNVYKTFFNFGTCNLINLKIILFCLSKLIFYPVNENYEYLRKRKWFSFLYSLLIICLFMASNITDFGGLYIEELHQDYEKKIFYSLQYSFIPLFAIFTIHVIQSKSISNIVQQINSLNIFLNKYAIKNRSFTFTCVAMSFARILFFIIYSLLYWGVTMLKNDNLNIHGNLHISITIYFSLIVCLNCELVLSIDDAISSHLKTIAYCFVKHIKFNYGNGNRTLNFYLRCFYCVCRINRDINWCLGLSSLNLILMNFIFIFSGSCYFIWAIDNGNFNSQYVIRTVLPVVASAATLVGLLKFTSKLKHTVRPITFIIIL